MMHSEHVVLRVVSKVLMPFILLFALYVQFHADFGPGGGFQAGMIFAAGIVLYALVFGLDSAQRVLPLALMLRLSAVGVLIFASVGVATVLMGGNFLDYNVLNPENPVAGQHLGVLLIEAGVGITVTSVMVSVFYGFAGRGISERGG